MHVSALHGAESKIGDGGAVVHGIIVADIPDVALIDIMPLVVYLSTPDAAALQSGERGHTTVGMQKVTQHLANFVPEFVVVAAGETLVFPNNDDILHNVFSYSKNNAFDLGLYPSGESRSVTFKNPGVVRVYCSIHKSMNATVFVAPSPFYSIVNGAGAFRIPSVRSGAYTLTLWSRSLPEYTRQIVIEETTVDYPVEFVIGQVE